MNGLRRQDWTEKMVFVKRKREREGREREGGRERGLRDGVIWVLHNGGLCNKPPCE